MTGLLKRARFVALDSSHLINLARELYAPDAATRTTALTLMDMLTTGNDILVLSFHHFQELLVYGDARVVAEQIHVLEALPLVALVSNQRGDGVAGSILELQMAEVLAAFRSPKATPRMVRDAVGSGIFRLTSGAEAVRVFQRELPLLHPEFVRMAARSREIVAIAQSDFTGVGHRRIHEFLSGKLCAPLDIQRSLARLGAALESEILQHGDKHIPDKSAVSAAFMADIAERGRTLEGSDNPGLQILAWSDVDQDEVTPDTTIGEVSDWAAFRAKLKQMNGALTLPWQELKRSVSESRIPSGIIDRALKRFRPRSAEWKGSDLIDTHLACLASYCDITFMDKRTHEGLQVARKKMKDLDSVLRRVEKAKNTRVVLERLTRKNS
ncbi:MAG: hypothetical protein QHD01_34065 [Bradyrhizobium sp.]|uniref:hypothetical protein n=1 Tax=Bradyrhizobium sp. TaxID=376 RepID=UPI0029A60D86|nr:hypothetical protein [Bradyrhizobium sp.]MDX3971602.1 hypothetical protein [Bradyrhizobium sp.]